MKNTSGTKGSVVLFMILSMVAVSGAFVVVSSTTQTSNISMAVPNYTKKSLYMAESGVRYALSELFEVYDSSNNATLVAVRASELNSTVYNITPQIRFTLGVDALKILDFEYKIGSNGTIDDSIYYKKNFQDFDLPDIRAGTAGNDDDEEDDGGDSGGGGNSDGGSHASDYVLSGGGTIITGNQVEIEGSIHSATSVVVSNQGEVSGDVLSGGDVTVHNQAEIGGDIRAAGDVNLNNQVVVYGDIHAHGNVTLSSDVVVMGTIYATGKVTLGSKAVVHGEIHAQGDVKIGSDADAKGAVYSGGNVTMQSKARAYESVDAQGEITLGSPATVDGDVSAYGNITLGSSSTVKGSAYSGGYVTLNWKAKVKGTIVQGVGKEGVSVTEPVEPDAYTPLFEPEATDFDYCSSSSCDVTIGWKKNAVLSPGEYRDLKINGKNEVTWESGNYYFRNIDAGGDQVDFYFDLSGGPINIFSQGSVTLGNQANIYVRSDSGKYVEFKKIDTDEERELASKIYAETHDDWIFGNQNVWLGTIYAGDQIKFNNQVEMIGSYYFGGTNTSGNQVELTYIPSDYAVAHWYPE